MTAVPSISYILFLSLAVFGLIVLSGFEELFPPCVESAITFFIMVGGAYIGCQIYIWGHARQTRAKEAEAGVGMWQEEEGEVETKWGLVVNKTSTGTSEREAERKKSWW